MYVTYEEPLKNKLFTEADLYTAYKNLVDKKEYPDYECWKADMLKSGVFERI